MPRPALAATEDEDTPRPDHEVAYLTCPLCRGRGLMEVMPDRQRPHHVILRPCIVCHGQGWVRRRLTPAGRSSNAVPS